MDVIIARLGPVIQELKLLRLEISRLADLRELDMNSRGITTRVSPATDKDLESTQVAYTDPEYEEIVSRIERRAGRQLTDEEVKNIELLLQEDMDIEV